MPPGPPRRLPNSRAGPGNRHIYMAYVGVGWAMARLPRFLWRRAAAAATDPLLRWLVHDRDGFHPADFRTDEDVRRQRAVTDFPGPPQGPTSYAARAIRPGIGPANWVVA